MDMDKKFTTLLTISLITVSLFLVNFVFVADYKQPIVETPETKEEAFPFAGMGLEAKAAYVFDIVKKEKVFGLNESAQLPLASITKIMTALVAKENIPEWEKIAFPVEAIKQEGDWGFVAGEYWSVKDLLSASLISSSNDAAYALGLSVQKNKSQNFLNLMNKKAKKLGLNQTYFLNPTGLDETEKIAGAYGSTKDISKMIIYAFENHPEMIGITEEESFVAHDRIFSNTNQLVEKIPGILAGKTGLTNLAGGNLAVIADIGFGHPVTIIVLGSTREGRFEDVQKLYEETYKWLNKQ